MASTEETGTMDGKRTSSGVSSANLHPMGMQQVASPQKSTAVYPTGTLPGTGTVIQRDPLKAIAAFWLPLVGVLLLGAAALIHRLDQTSLWADEGWTIAATGVDNPADVVREWVAGDVHPPLFFLGLYGWRQVTGDSIFEMRYYSVLITLTGIAVMYRLGRALFSPMAGVLAALFFALHDLVLVLTQEVRHYPQPLTLTALTLWLYWRIWQQPTWRRGAAFALSGAALIWSHYWGAFILLALACHALITRRRQMRLYLVAFGGIGLLYLPWLPTLYDQMTTERPDGLPHALENSWTVYKVLAFQLAGTPEIFWLGLAAFGVLGILVAAQPKDWRPSPASTLPALAIILTVVLSILLNTRYPSLSFRSLAVVIPPLLVLVAHTLAQFRWRERLIMVSFLVIHSLTTTAAAPVERAPWPDMADFIVRHTTQDELVLLEMDTDDYALAYYLDHSGGKLRRISTEGERKSAPDEYPAFLSETLAGENGLWIAKFGWPFYDIRPELEARGFMPTAAIEWPFYADGRPIMAWRYDRPASGKPHVVFGDVMRLMRFSYTTGDGWATINCLWSPAQRPDRNYTISTFLLNSSGVLVSQHDSYPFENRFPTLDWEAKRTYFDSHVLSTEDLPPGEYQLGLKVYYFLDASFQQFEIAKASDCSVNAACEFITLGTVSIPED